VNSSKRSWATQADKLRPLVTSGQAQLGNHSHHHSDLTTLSNAQVHKELKVCHDFILNEYGVDARPYWRPPFGRVDLRVAAVAADLGYTKPTLWNKNLLDAKTSSKPADVLARFKTEAVPGAIMLDHIHGLEDDKDFAKAMQMLEAINLKSVTLNEAFAN